MVGNGKAPSRRASSRRISRDAHEAAHELGRERVIEIQRARLITALFEVSAERGAGNVTVAHVVDRAGVSRRTFYELFAGCEECFLAAFDDAIARASSHVLNSYDPKVGWAQRIRTALVAMLEFLDVERSAGQLLVVGSLGAGSRAIERRQRVLAAVVAVVDEGRNETKLGAELPPLTAEGIVGGVLSVLHTRLLTDDPGSLNDLTQPLMSMIVLPYLGPAAARKEFDRPAPKRQIAGRVAPSDSLRDAGIRFTYRTVCVLTSIAENPGSSNREVGVGAGMEDQGQISKLLARLQGRGLIENMGDPVRGVSNSWVLTTRGREVQGAISQQTADV